MLNDFTCFLSHAVYLYFLTIAHRHCQMETLVQSSVHCFWLLRAKCHQRDCMQEVTGMDEGL